MCLGRIQDRVLAEVPEELDRIYFAPDGSQAASSAVQGSNFLVVVDGMCGKEFTDIRDFRFSDDGRHWAYRGLREGKWYVVGDGQRGEG